MTSSLLCEKETVNCPYCHESSSHPWASENGYTAVKCTVCGLVYVNPRPLQSQIEEAVETGVHRDVAHGRTAINRRVEAKVGRYKSRFRSLLRDVWESPRPISWLDVGAGYGEVVEAVAALAPSGSRVEGIEPMKPKAEAAKARGICVTQGYLSDVHDQFDHVSVINVFSHVPDFHGFLREVSRVLNENGQLVIETGNIGDLVSPDDAPSELDLPDHVVFAGEQNMKDFLRDAGFVVQKIERIRCDGVCNSFKNIVKKALGRNVSLSLPYTSPYRSMLIRASWPSL